MKKWYNVHAYKWVAGLCGAPVTYAFDAASSAAAKKRVQVWVVDDYGPGDWEVIVELPVEDA